MVTVVIEEKKNKVTVFKDKNEHVMSQIAAMDIYAVRFIVEAIMGYLPDGMIIIKEIK